MEGFATAVAAGALLAGMGDGDCASKFAEKMMAKNAITNSDLQNSFTSKLLMATPMACYQANGAAKDVYYALS